MPRVVISFLGRTPRSFRSPELGERRTGYQRARYRFAHGTVENNGDQVSDPVSFLGLEIADRVGAHCLVILGTAGSMWDCLLADDFEIDGDDQGRWLSELRLRVDEKTVDVPLLQNIENALNQIGERRYCLRLIPTGIDTEDQLRILHELSPLINPGDKVHMDLTHGYRHLPMLGLVAMRFLRTLGKVSEGGLFYGFFDPEADKGSPHSVFELSGLGRMLDWLEAMHRFDKDCDYGVFGPLLKAENVGESARRLLANAAFYERTMQPKRARDAARKAITALQQHQSPMLSLFLPELKKKILSLEETNSAKAHIEQALRFLDTGDYQRSTLYALEAIIAFVADCEGVSPEGLFVKLKNQAKKDGHREISAASYCIAAAGKRWGVDVTRALKRLRALRNSMAHANAGARQDIGELLGSPDACNAFLRDTLTRIAAEVAKGARSTLRPSPECGA